MHEDNDDEWMRRIAQKDRQAFDRLVRAYHNAGYGYLLRMGLQRAQVEDIMQEGFIKVWQNAHTFKIGQPFAPWFYTILHHLACDGFKKQALLPLEKEPQGHDRPEDLLTQTQHHQAIGHHIKRLNEQEKNAFVLFYYQNMSIQQISQILDIKPSTIEVTLYRAREKLKAWLKGVK